MYYITFNQRGQNLVGWDQESGTNPVTYTKNTKYTYANYGVRYQFLQYDYGARGNQSFLVNFLDIDASATYRYINIDTATWSTAYANIKSDLDIVATLVGQGIRSGEYYSQWNS